MELDTEYLSDTFGMFSPEGDRLVAAMVAQARDQADRLSFLRAEFERIGSEYGEVHDTAVREEILDALDDEHFDPRPHLISTPEAVSATAN